MLNRLDLGWRRLATAFSFFVFGVGGILLPVLATPVLALLPGDQRQRGKKLVRYAFRGYIGLMRLLGVLTYEVRGLEKLTGKPNLILANHPSLIDVIFLLALIPNANCVVKGRLLRNPFTRGPIRAAGYIANETAEGVIEAATDSFSRGSPLVIFPEGTRTTPHEPLKLKRGAAHLALRTGANITPVVIQSRPTTLTKRDRWYEVPSRRVHFRIKVGDEIAIGNYLNSVPSRAARTLTNHLTDYFIKELDVHEQLNA